MLRRTADYRRCSSSLHYVIASRLLDGLASREVTERWSSARIIFISQQVLKPSAISWLPWAMTTSLADGLGAINGRFLAGVVIRCHRHYAYRPASSCYRRRCLVRSGTWASPGDETGCAFRCQHGDELRQTIEPGRRQMPPAGIRQNKLLGYLRAPVVISTYFINQAAAFSLVRPRAWASCGISPRRRISAPYGRYRHK